MADHPADEADELIPKKQGNANVTGALVSSPKSVASPKVFDDNLTEEQQEHTDSEDYDDVSQAESRETTPLEGYEIGDEAKTTDFTPDMSKEEAALAAKSLEVGDAAFILRSDSKWTYAVVTDKTVEPDGPSSLKFEVAVDSSKTFIEARWGKYVRVIKTTEESTVVAEGAATGVVASDPDLLIYESDSDEENLKDDDQPNERVTEVAKEDAAADDDGPKDELDDKPEDEANETANSDADADAADDTDTARPKGILRKKEETSPESNINPIGLVKKTRSSVSFAKLNTKDDAESKGADDIQPKAAVDAEQVAGTDLESKAADDAKEVIGADVESKAADDAKPATETDVESKAADDATEGTGTGQDKKEDSVFDEVEEEDTPEPEQKPELFPAKEITFPTEVKAELPGVNDEMSAVSHDKNLPSEEEESDETAPSKDGKEDSVTQTPTSSKDGPTLFGLNLSPVQLSMDSIIPSMNSITPSKIGEKTRDMGQMLLNFTQPIFTCPQAEVDDLKYSESSTPSKVPVPEEDIVEESLTIECEFQSMDDIKVHENNLTPLPAIQAESEDENKSDDVKTNDDGATSLPATGAIQSATELSSMKKDALNFHKRKGVVPKTSLKLMKNKFSRKKKVEKVDNVEKIDLDAMNVTADTIDSFEVHL